MSAAVVDLQPRGFELRPSRAAAQRPAGGPPAAPWRVPRAEGRRSSMRLTRRGRLVLLVAVLLAVLAAFMLMSGPAVSSGDAQHATSQSVVVGPGETLWAIAQRIAPGEDPRDVIAEIVELNALSDAGTIRVGQKLIVPAG